MSLPIEPPFGSAWRIRPVHRASLVWIALRRGEKSSLGGQEWIFLAVAPSGWTQVVDRNLVWTHRDGTVSETWEPAE